MILCEEQDVPLPRQASTGLSFVETLQVFDYDHSENRAKEIHKDHGLGR